MSRVYKDGETSPNGVTHGPKLHRIDCDLCDDFVERKHFAPRDYDSRTDVGYRIPEGLYFAGTASDPEPFALQGWASFNVVTAKQDYTDRSDIEGYDVCVVEEQIDICPRHVGDVLGMIVHTKPR